MKTHRRWGFRRTKMPGSCESINTLRSDLCAVGVEEYERMFIVDEAIGSMVARPRLTTRIQSSLL